MASGPHNVSYIQKNFRHLLEAVLDCTGKEIIRNNAKFNQMRLKSVLQPTIIYMEQSVLYKRAIVHPFHHCSVSYFLEF